MTAPRPLPWTALLEALGEERLADIRTALASRNADPLDRDAFVLEASVGRVLRDLVPEDAPAETLTAYAGLLHAFYLHWAVGRPIRVAGRERLRARLAAPAVPASPAPGVSYVQLPERLVWAAPAPDAAHEPLDGMFVVAAPDRVRVLAVLGFRPGREGFTTMEAVSPLPPVSPTARDDGAAPFATVLPAGERMGFFSVTSESELVALALLAHAEAAG